jgi:hypothetical protein
MESMTITKKRAALWAGLAIVGTAAAALITGCVSDSDRASQNISTEAEQFRIERQIVFYNSITDKYMVTINGRCSVDDSADLARTLAVTCKIGPNKYIKDYLGKADNISWFSLQSKPVDVSVYHYEVIFKPETVIPDLRVESGKQ